MKAFSTLLLIFAFSSTSLYAQEDTSPEIFTIVENNPEFIGGQDAMYEYLAKNLSYPAAAKDAGIQGIVYVTFVIIETGKVTGVKLLRGIGGGCDEEALRVVESMPYWNAGTQRGKKVKVQFNLPIRFYLAPNKKKGLFNRNK